MAESRVSPKSYGTVLVIGGCGFLGSRVVDQLLNFPSEQQGQNESPGGSSLGRETQKHSYELHNPATSDITSVTFPSLRSRYPPISPTGTRVHALDLRCTQNLFSGCTYHEADITNSEALLNVFRKVKPDVVINTASPSWEAPPEVLRKVNIDGTRTLLEVAGGKLGDWGGKCKVFSHTSSSSVVHDGDSDLINADERYPYVCPNPREYYSETKVYAEKLALEANDKPEYGNMLTCAVRPAGIVGEGDRGGFSGAILRTASVAPAWQLHIQLGTGNNLFDNTYVHNVVYGLLCATDALLATHARRRSGLAVELDHERVDGEAFNVTNEQPAYFWDSSRYLYSRYGRTIDIDKIWAIPTGLAYAVGAAAETFNWLTGRKGKLNRQTVKYACIHRFYSCDKLRRRTGYKPIVPIDEGFARAVKWYKLDEEQSRQTEGQKKVQ
ncbi:Sterol-4-alpha-carboxylate 3-dehydrogenase erg26, decarboxylating [Exophiala dermatitidis]